MKTSSNSFIFAALAFLALSPIVAQAQQVQTQQTRHDPIEIKSQTLPRIEQVILKNGPLADFYELVAQHSVPRSAVVQVKEKETAAPIAQADKVRERAPVNQRQELDKLPQHSAK